MTTGDAVYTPREWPVASRPSFERWDVHWQANPHEVASKRLREVLPIGRKEANTTSGRGVSSNKVDRKRIDASKVDYPNFLRSRRQTALGKDVVCREITAAGVFPSSRSREMAFGTLRPSPQSTEKNLSELVSTLNQVTALRHYDDVALGVSERRMFCPAIIGKVGWRRKDPT